MNTPIKPRFHLLCAAFLLLAIAPASPHGSAATLAPQAPSSDALLRPGAAWHTFYGTNTMDEGWSVALDGSGNVYLTGYSHSDWLGDGNASPLHAHSGNEEVFVIKLDSQGVYQWHTFYGSGGADYGSAIAVDEDGDVYVSGCSDATWNGDDDTPPLHPRSGSAQDLFVLKLDSDGAYQWHTFYGGGSTDSGNAIAIDENGDIVVAGEAFGSWLGDGDAQPLHPATPSHEIFVMRLGAGGAYQWHTFYGNELIGPGLGSAEKAYAVALDEDGYIYVGGESMSSWLGDNDTQPIHPHSGGYDWTVLKLDSGGGYEWHTFYGAAEDDTAFGIAVDAFYNVYLAGQTTGTWQGDNHTDPLHAASGLMDLGVLALDSKGLYMWHTFYGAGANDSGGELALDEHANIYLVGTSMDWLGDNSQPPIHPPSGDFDQVVLALDPDGGYRWHTYYGSSSSDAAHGLAMDPDGPLYFTGASQYSWLRGGANEPLHAHSGWIDISLVKLDERLVYLPLLDR